ncbi:MAG TPA: amino acid adenylation domain-containing protein, partial [Polyangiaceae bacterium]|nr:amino acid adenylation domain-containing protein [Polyangiaceae bacterium]
MAFRSFAEQQEAQQRRPRTPSFRAALDKLRLEPRQLAALRELCREHELTPSSVALAALEVVLARYGAQDDFGIGVSTRPADAEERVGMHARTLVLRSDVKNDLSFRELLQRVHARCEQGLLHDEVAAREPQVVFTGLEALPRDLKIDGLRLERLDVFSGYSSSELSFHLRDEGSGVELSLVSASDLFEPESAARLCRSWLSVLGAAVQNPDLALDELPVIAPADERHLLDVLNDTRTSFDEGALVHRLFEAQVDAQPDAVALVFEEQCLTFAELDVRANRLAQLLVSRGVGPDTLVGLSLRRTPDLVVAMLAILKAGGAYVPLDPDYPPDRIEYVLADSKAKVLLTSSDIAARLSAKPDCVTIDDDAAAIEQAPSERLRREERPAQLCYVIYTSGSTGKPKGVMVEHRNATSFFAGMRRAIGLDARGVWLAATSISFDISVLEILGSLSHGRRVVLLGEAVLGQVADPRYGIAAQIARQGVTHFQCTPSQARILLLDEAGRAALASLEQMLVGGEAMSQELAGELSGLVRGDVFNLYGPTETTVWSTFSRVERGARVSIGRPIANTSLFVLDARGRLVPAGAVGELYIGGPGVTRGYHGRAELTRERFVDNEHRPELGARLYRTGDLVRYAADGSLLYLGRNDHQVKIRGHRIELGEIESIVRKAQGVRDVAVVARGSADNQRLVAYLVTDATFRGDEALRSLLRETLPDFMLPAAFVQLDALPLTPNGKTDRNALPEPAVSNLAASEYVAPRDERERKLAEIWQRALGVPRVGRSDDFFDLGGHSLLAVKISNEVER